MEQLLGISDWLPCSATASAQAGQLAAKRAENTIEVQRSLTSAQGMQYHTKRVPKLLAGHGLLIPKLTSYCCCWLLLSLCCVADSWCHQWPVCLRRIPVAYKTRQATHVPPCMQHVCDYGDQQHITAAVGLVSACVSVPTLCVWRHTGSNGDTGIHSRSAKA
jgi:hypothetical protein